MQEETEQGRKEEPAEERGELAEENVTRLERVFIETYLRDKGYTMESLKKLPDETAKKLMTEACIYASNKLAEVEARAHFVHQIHDASHSVSG